MWFVTVLSCDSIGWLYLLRIEWKIELEASEQTAFYIANFFSKFTHIQRLCYKISDANYSCLNISCLLGFRKCRTLKWYFRIIFPTVIIKVKSVIRTILLDFLLKSLQLACNLITPTLPWKLLSLLDQMLIRHPDFMNANVHLHLCYAKA